MAESPASLNRAAKRIKLGGETFYGKTKTEFLGNNIVKIKFHILDFANLLHERDDYLYTDSIKAHGHPWKLLIYPRGDDESNAEVEMTSIYLLNAAENTETDPGLTNIFIRTKTVSKDKEFEYFNSNKCFGWKDFNKRENIIENDCNEVGTLTITVELEIGTEKRSVWFPQLTYCDYRQLYNSATYSDILFIIGTPKMEFFGHKCILFLRVKVLCDLVDTEASSSENNNNNNNSIVLADVDEKAFEVILRFLYTSEVPKFNKDDNNNKETMKSILTTANRFGVTELKLYIESMLIEKFLTPSNAASFLLFADSHSCGLLKEFCMNEYVTDSISFMDSQDDWKQLQESNKLLVELLVYATSDRKRYSSVINDGNGTVEDADEFDVTSLRERLQRVELDVDGSRVMIVERWKNYLRTNNNGNNNNKTSDDIPTV